MVDDERLDTRIEEMGSRRGAGHSKNLNLISPLQIIRQGCISFDSGHGNERLGGPQQDLFEDEPFDNILSDQRPNIEKRLAAQSSTHVSK